MIRKTVCKNTRKAYIHISIYKENQIIKKSIARWQTRSSGASVRSSKESLHDPDILRGSINPRGRDLVGASTNSLFISATLLRLSPAACFRGEGSIGASNRRAQTRTRLTQHETCGRVERHECPLAAWSDCTHRAQSPRATSLRSDITNVRHFQEKRFDNVLDGDRVAHV